MDVRRGIIRSFNSTTYVATVEIIGSRPNYLSIPAAKYLAANLLTAGSKVAVLFFDETNPNDAMVLGPYDGAPSAWITTGLLTDDCVDDTKIDWGTGAGQVSAADVPIADAGGVYDASDVEAALQEIFAKDVTKTVGSGKDFATIQAAINWFKGRIISGSCKIAVDAGTYDEAIVFEDLFIAKSGALELEGDTRVLAGISYVDGAAGNQAGLANGGSGIVTLSNAGNNITVACATTNPDFDADGWGNGDRILVYDNTGTVSERIISSVSNNVITLTIAAPNVGNDATAICLLPNHKITSAGIACIKVDQVQGIQLDGWHLSASVYHSLLATTGGSVTCENIAAQPTSAGFYANDFYSWLSASDGACSAWGGSYGVIASGAHARVVYMQAVGCARGFYANVFSYLYPYKAVAANCTYGYYATHHALLSASYASARQNTVGYDALYGAYLYAAATNANNNGNGTNYVPAPAIPGSTQGSHYAVIYAS